MADNQEEGDVFDALINCLETSNKLLKTFYDETPPGIKKDAILKMIETNARGVVLALDQPSQSINQGTLPDHREKPLTLGLTKAKEIIKKYAQQQAGVEYEYTRDAKVWQQLKNKKNLQILIELGFWVRKKQHV